MRKAGRFEVDLGQAVVAALLLALCALTLAAFADGGAEDGADGAAAATNVWLVSDVARRPGWRRDAVMERDGTNLVDRTGSVAAKADGAAVETVARGAAEVAEAAGDAMDAAVQSLASVTGQVPARAQHVVLLVRPDLAARAALTFVLTNAAVSADGRTLSFVAAANRLCASRPSMSLTFGDGVSGDETAKVRWAGEWDAASAAHAGSVEIPAKYRGRPTCLYENVRLGDGAGLFDFGAVAVTVGGRAAWNGALTNALDGAELKVENGFVKQAKGEN